MNVMSGNFRSVETVISVLRFSSTPFSFAISFSCGYSDTVAGPSKVSLRLPL